MSEVIGGRYRLEHRLGAGGMKEVWRARDEKEAQPVALALLYDFDPALFESEVELARRVDSPHVARVLAGGVTGDRAYVVNELCEGPDLRLYRGIRGALPWREAVWLAREIALGLRAIHEAHVLHRDIKPDNAILTRGAVKVIDFGISVGAADADTGVDRPLPPAGTLAYMAPEIFDGEVDARTDVYALGVTLYELVAGRAPLSADTPAEMIGKVLALKEHDLSPLGEIPPALRDLIAELVDPRRDRRPFVPAALERMEAIAAARPPFPDDLFPSTAPAPASPTAPGPEPAPTRLSHPVGERAPFRCRTVARLEAPVAPPGVLATPWPQAPYVALTETDGTRIAALAPDGRSQWALEVPRHLRRGLLADLDGDGVAELYLWSLDALLSFDAAGEQRFEIALPRPPDDALPWDREAPTACVAPGADGGRALMIAGRVIDGAGRKVGEHGARFQGTASGLDRARGTRGFSLFGDAMQSFRGDFATPAALLTAPGDRGFHVAHLERVIGNPAVKLSIYGPGGGKTTEAVVGVYDFKTAPLEVFARANDPGHPLFREACAPLAVAREGGHTVLVPYLTNAPWFGPVVVAIDAGSGEELWRTRLPAFRAGAGWPPLLAEVSGRIELLVATGSAIERIRFDDGRRMAPLPTGGVPVSLGDAACRGRDELAVAAGDRLELWEGAETLHGRMRWVGERGDLWRSGALGRDRLPLGPLW